MARRTNAKYHNATVNPEIHFGTKKAFQAYKKSIQVILSNMFDFAYLPKGEGMEWSQTSLSQRANVSIQTLRRLENACDNNDSIRCYFDTVWKICYALGYELQLKNGALDLKIRKKKAA